MVGLVAEGCLRAFPSPSPDSTNTIRAIRSHVPLSVCRIQFAFSPTRFVLGSEKRMDRGTASKPLEKEVKRPGEKAPQEFPLARRDGIGFGEEIHQGKNSQTVEPGMPKQPQPGLPARFLALPRQN